MSSKTHPTTVRLTEQEQTFLASLSLPGATTASDKIRALIREKQRQQASESDYGAALDSAQSLLNPIQQRLRLAENSLHMHSQLVRRVLEWTPEMTANLMHGLPGDEASIEAQHLVTLEGQVAQRAMQLLDTLLQSYIARDTALYRVESLGTENFRPLARLCQLVNNDVNTTE